MNSSKTFGEISSECQIYIFLGGILDETTAEAYTVLVFLIVLSVIASPVTTVLNLLVMIAVRTKPRMKTMSNIALGCLAVTDCLMGIIGLPLFVTARIFTLQATTSSDFCILPGSSRYALRILGGVGMLHLVLMNVERYLAIKHALNYTAMVTEVRIIWSSVLLWIATLFLTIPLGIMDVDIYLAVNNTVLFVCVAIVTYCQLVVYLETCRHAKHIAAHQISMEIRQNFLKEQKAFKVTTIVLLTLLMTYAPIFVVQIFMTNLVITSKNGAYIAFFVATFVLILTSLINPVIYCLRTRQFRVAFFEILFRKRNTQERGIGMKMRVSHPLNVVNVAQIDEGQERKKR